MIGNDIVDLQLAAQESNWRRKGYLAKVFTAAERELIESAIDPDQQVWLLWACKEAAYKAWSTEFGKRCYAPRQMRIISWKNTGLSEYQALLATQERTYSLRASVCTNYVHALTQVEPVRITWHEHLYLPKTDILTARSRIHQAVRQACNKQLAWPLADIELRSSEQGRPLLYYHGEPSDLYLSWSHHGHWAEWCIGMIDARN